MGACVEWDRWGAEVLVDLLLTDVRNVAKACMRVRCTNLSAAVSALNGVCGDIKNLFRAVENLALGRTAQFQSVRSLSDQFTFSASQFFISSISPT